MDKLLDNARTGPMYLKIPEIAQLIADSIERGRSDYQLHAWVIMSNHVHLLITPRTNVRKLMQKLKGSTAREANKLLGHTGRFWQEESYDRLVRNAEEFRRIERYIIWNPVKAGIVASPELYRWSSAGGLKPNAA